MSSRLLILTFLICSGLFSCASAPHLGKGQFLDGCVPTQRCTLVGRLELYAGQPAWASLLKSGGECAKLALPDDFYGSAATWNGRRVVVVGRAFQQPGVDQGGGNVVLWYTEKGRKLSMGMCDGGVGIYVDSITSHDGRKWIAPPAM